MEKNCVLCGTRLTKEEVAITDVCQGCTDATGLAGLIFVQG